MAEDKPVVVLGGGLSGCLFAIYLAKRGYNVEIYEKRPDYRGAVMTEGKSINMALSARGISALKKVGLDEEVINTGIPMYGRMLHGKDGTLHFQPYGQPHQYNLSVGRQVLNEILLTAAEKAGVKVYYDSQVTAVDVKNASFTTVNKKDNSTTIGEARLVVGADGSFSPVRQAMVRSGQYNYSQTFLDHGYKELHIPATASGDYALDHRSLHIWPRGDFMMIALPNPDKSFTVTVFMPWDGFNALKSTADVKKFFDTEFSDAVPLMPTLLKDWEANKSSSLVTVNCAPWNADDKAVLIGDACHAMVPFYGQGMNASLQDVEVFFDLLAKEKNDLSSTVRKYTSVRKPDADAICTLSHENYLVMRSKVTSRLFLWRKKLEIFLNKIWPNSFLPLYTMVSFTTIPYSKTRVLSAKNDSILNRILFGVPALLVLIAFAISYPFYRPALIRALTNLRDRL